MSELCGTLDNNYLHVALSDSAVGCLRAACQSGAMPGTVIGIPDDLSHGPLDDLQVRRSYFQNLFIQSGARREEACDILASWRCLMAEAGRIQTREVVVWAGENVSETMFLHMFCDWMHVTDIKLSHVNVSESSDQHYVAMWQPSYLAGICNNARELNNAEREHHSSEYRRLCAEKGVLRRWSAGRVATMQSNFYDDLLLSSCTTDWSVAGRVVGLAMSRCDAHNRLSDLFFASRLAALIENGLIEVQKKTGRLFENNIRMSASSPAHESKAWRG